MDRITLEIWLRNAIYITAIILLITTFSLERWGKTFGFENNTSDVLALAAGCIAFVCLTFGVITDIHVRFLTANKLFTKEGWNLSAIIVHVPEQPDTVITEGVSSKMLNTSYYQSILRGWVNTRNSNPESNEAKLQLSAGITPVTYVFTRREPQAEDDALPQPT